MSEIIRQGMVKTVTVREYEDEAKFIRVTIKSPTDLPLAAWASSSSGTTRHVDEFDIALPLNAQVRPGDLVAFRIQITQPYNERQRFQLALDVGEDDDNHGTEVLEVNVEDGMKAEA